MVAGQLPAPVLLVHLLQAGASLLQIYSGLVYEGPQITRIILKGLTKRLAREGFTELSQAVGTEQ